MFVLKFSFSFSEETLGKFDQETVWENHLGMRRGAGVLLNQNFPSQK